MPHHLTTLRQMPGLSSRSKSRLNVKDWGAYGDDSHDDTTAVQNAINAAAGMNGVCYFPAGTYITSHLTIPAYVTLEGPPTFGNPRPTSWAAELKSKAGESGNNYSQVNGSDVTIRWLSFNGNRASSSLNGLIYGDIGPTNVLIEGCKFYASFVEGIENNGGTYWLVSGCTFDDNDYGLCWMGETTCYCLGINNTFNNPRGTSGAMSNINGAHHNIHMNSQVTNTGTTSNRGYAEGGLSPHHNELRGCTFTDIRNSIYLVQGGNGVYDGNTIIAGANTTQHGIYLETTMGAGNVISNNVIDGVAGSSKYPIEIRVPCTVSGNTVTDSNQVDFAASSVVFTDNIIDGALGNGTRFYDADTDNMTITGNIFRNCQRAGFYCSSPFACSGWVFNDNIAYNNGQRDGYPNTYDGFGFGSAVAFTSFNNNQGYDTRAIESKTQRRGVTIFTGSTGTYSGNVMPSPGETNANLTNPGYSWDGLTPA